MNINHTRTMVRAALNGELDDVHPARPIFGGRVPTEVPGVPSGILRSALHVGRRRRVRRPGGEARPDVRGQLPHVRRRRSAVRRESRPLVTDDGGPGLELAGPGEG